MYKIDKNKNIGNVIFVVEGGRAETGGTELNLIKAIFSDILGYKVTELRRGGNEFICHGQNEYSQVFALNLPKNQLTTMTEEALDALFRRIREECLVKPEDCPIFFLYDRDYLSYQPNQLRGKYVKKYVDPYSNDSGDQGQLLLSYPSVESYLLSCFTTDLFTNHFFLGKDIKSEVSAQGICVGSLADESHILHAVEEMDKGLFALGIASYDIDSLSQTLLSVYDSQQQLFNTKRACSALSLISMALLEIGIIVED